MLQQIEEAEHKVDMASISKMGILGTLDNDFWTPNGSEEGQSDSSRGGLET